MLYLVCGIVSILHFQLVGNSVMLIVEAYGSPSFVHIWFDLRFLAPFSGTDNNEVDMEFVWKNYAWICN